MNDSNRGGKVTTDPELQAMHLLIKADADAMALLATEAQQVRVREWFHSRCCEPGPQPAKATMAGQPDRQLGPLDGHPIGAEA
jgi:hypothetical protein